MTQIVSANRLRDGLVVYLSAEGTWSERIGEAAEAADEAGAQKLMAAAMAAGRCVVEPYLVEVAISTGGRRPVRHRESIRVSGPTVQTRLNRRLPGVSAQRNV